MAKFYLVQKNYSRISLCDHSRMRPSIQKYIRTLRWLYWIFLGRITPKFEH